ncbi:MAG: chemotaxis protein CheA [Methylococcales bacterium]|nr:chemotaxis protein CheA [Methylococcales bacterium]
MNSLLEQFLSEARDFLQGIGEKLMQLESDPTSNELMVELFRFVHTLKGNSGLFDFPEMTRVLHASEDLMDAVRNGRVNYSQKLADQLLDAMDFVGMLMDEIEATEKISNKHAAPAAELTKALRNLLTASEAGSESSEIDDILNEITQTQVAENSIDWESLPTLNLPEDIAEQLHAHSLRGDSVFWVEYTPEADSFFKGEDPFYLIRQVPDTEWRNVVLNSTVENLAEMDVFNSVASYQVLTHAPAEELEDLFRYIPDEHRRIEIPALAFVKPSGNTDEHAVDEDFIANVFALFDKDETEEVTRTINTMLELSAPDLWSSSALRWVLRLIEREPENKAAQRALLESLRTLQSPDWSELKPVEVIATIAPPVRNAVVSTSNGSNGVVDEKMQYFNEVINAQREILNLSGFNEGRLKSVGASLIGCYKSIGRSQDVDSLELAIKNSLVENSQDLLLKWLDHSLENAPELVVAEKIAAPVNNLAMQNDVKFGRRAEDAAGRKADEPNAVTASKTLKVDQEKIDRLMNLIGEMVVAKNALPYLAARAETVFGVRDLSREIKAQYAVINRVAEEMQDTIMQVRMLPVSFIFQRFPRMVRDISRKLGKEVDLVLEGESTEADKNIIEALSDPLIHIVRNSLDHGLEQPDVRIAAGKNGTGKLLIRASQESDRVLIEIIDDGKGINPEVIKHKAYEKGLIDEATMERISDQDAVNLVFAAGFSTADVISDLSGRGVGMDVVRSAVEKVNGTVGIESEVGKGTRLYLSLPLSMAVTNVMIIQSNKQIFGVPMDMVVETVRVPRVHIQSIKQKQTTVLRGRIVPLLPLNDLLASNMPQLPNENDEFATLIVRVHGEHVGILVDDFRETVDIILKPMTGILGGLGGYSGAALLGDGSVLMVLNPRELM